MSGYSLLTIGLGCLGWVAISSRTLDIRALVVDETVTACDIIIAFALEPLMVLVGLIVFGVIFFRCHIPFEMQKRDEAIVPTLQAVSHK